MHDLTTRDCAESAIEVRRGPDGPTRLAGYAAVFGHRSGDLGGFREIVAPGAFGPALEMTGADGDIRALYEHDPRQLLGRRSAGTLRLRQDAHGLAVEVDLPPTQLGRDLAAQVERGDVAAWSFGFRTIEDSWDYTEDTPVRTLHAVDVREVSAVSVPAYQATEMELASLAPRIRRPSQADLRRRVRLAGLRAVD